MGLTAIVDLLRTLTAIVDWESRSALTPVPLGARLADLDSHESQASLLSHSLLGDQIQKVNCATECEDMPITSSTSSSKLCGRAPVLFCELDGQRSSPRQGAHVLLSVRGSCPRAGGAPARGLEIAEYHSGVLIAFSASWL